MEPEDLEGVPVDEARKRVLDFLDEYAGTVKAYSTGRVMAIQRDGVDYELRVADLYTLADHSRRK